MDRRAISIWAAVPVFFALMVACSGGQAQPATNPTLAATPAAEPTATAETVPVPGGGLTDILNASPEKLAELVMTTPGLLGCLSSAVGMPVLMELAERAATTAETEAIIPCFEEAESLMADAEADLAKTAPKPTRAPSEGTPWYGGPLFDTHMHLTGLTNPYFGDMFSTGDVLAILDRHDIQGGVGFYLPPVTGLDSEAAAVRRSVEDLKGRMVALLLPPPFDLGTVNEFSGLPRGTYTTDLLADWFPPQGQFDGFGEIAFYTGFLSGLYPNSPELADIYPLVAQSGGVVMMHPRDGMTADDLAGVVGRYPEITFLFHGTSDPDGFESEGAPILGLLDDYAFENVFYTLDVASVLQSNQYPGTLQMDPESAGEFVGLMESLGVQDLAQQAFDDYGALITDHPDRTMWGTDALH